MQTTDVCGASCFWLDWGPWFFFSISSAKANYYLVVVMPFAALHLALALQEREYLGRIGRLAPGLLLAMQALAACVYLALHPYVLPYSLTIYRISKPGFLIIAFSVIAVVALLAALLATRVPRIGLLAYLAPTVCISFVLLKTGTAWISKETRFSITSRVKAG